MSAKKRARKAGSAAREVAANPAVQRLMEDEDLREQIRDTFDTAKDAYGRLANGKGPTKALLEDKKLQKELRETAAALKDVGNALREGPKRRSGGGLGKLVMLLLIGGGVAVAASGGLRQKVLDALFGKEEEFDYSPAATAAPAPAATPSTPAAS